MLIAISAAIVWDAQRASHGWFAGWLLSSGVLVCLLLGVWWLVLPGSLRLDADGVRRGRKRWAWTEVASFRLDRGPAFSYARTYRLPTTAEEAEMQRVGSSTPEAIAIPVSVAGMTPWRAVALLNHYRSEAARAAPQDD